MGSIFTCAGNSWQPVIGDPTALGWFTCIAYMVAALLALIAVKAAPPPPSLRRGSFRSFWFILAALLLLLGINKQLDLQSALTAVGRCASQLDGWYENRRSVQFGFIVMLIIIALISFISALVYFKRIAAECWLAILGGAFLVGFVCVRAMSFHDVDALISSRVLGIRMNGILELSGIFAIGINAIYVLLRKPEVPLTESRYEPRGNFKPMDLS